MDSTVETRPNANLGDIHCDCHCIVQMLTNDNFNLYIFLFHFRRCLNGMLIVEESA